MRVFSSVSNQRAMTLSSANNHRRPEIVRRNKACQTAISAVRTKDEHSPAEPLPVEDFSAQLSAGDDGLHGCEPDQRTRLPVVPAQRVRCIFPVLTANGPSNRNLRLD